MDYAALESRAHTYECLDCGLQTSKVVAASRETTNATHKLTHK